jgi:hypothetical protein
MRYLIICLLFFSYSSFGNMQIDELWNSCQDIKAFDLKLKKLQEDADKTIKTKGDLFLRNSFKKKDDFYDFIVLFSPFLIPSDFMFSSFLKDCWIDLEDSLEAIRKKNKNTALLKIKQWSACQKSGFRDELPERFQKLEGCLLELVKN